MLFLIVLAFAGPFIMKRPDGRPLLSINDITSRDSSILTSIRTIAGLFRSQTAEITSDKSLDEDTDLTSIHKWQDDEGQWHFSDQRPETVSSELIKINPNQNILEMNDAEIVKKRTETDAENSKKAADLAKNLDPPQDMIPGLPTIDQAKQAMDKAKAVQELLNQHYKDIEKH